MRTVHILLTSAAFVLASFASHAQQWQLVTPIKVGSELRGMRMTDTFTGYAIDVAGKIALKTTDAGGQWERRGNGFSPYTPNALWMWDNDRGIVATNNGRFFRTTDGFTTTTAVITTFGTIGSLFFVNDLLGFAGANSGKILRTVDGGATWVQLVSGVANNIDHLFFVDAELGFASVGTSVLRTSDGGDTWAEIALEPGAYVS